MKTAIYPISADPIHLGHLQNIQRILNLNLFDKIYIAIGNNYEKKSAYLFTEKERLYLTKAALKSLNSKKIIVESFSGLLAHYAKLKNTNLIIRGLRNNTDFETEQILATINQTYGLQTLILPSTKEIFSLSSSKIKEAISNGGLVAEFVPLVCKQALEEKLLKINLIGVVGNTGSGKTDLCKKLAVLNKNIHHLEADKIIKDLYNDNLVQQKMIKLFGNNIYLKNIINAKKLAQIIFSDKEKRLQLVELLRLPFKMALENKIKNLNSLILVDCAYLVEYGLLPWVNNNIMLLTCPDNLKIKRNKKAINTLPVQYPEKKLKQEINQAIQQEAYGHLLQINTAKTINYQAIIKHLEQWQILRA